MKNIKWLSSRRVICSRCVHHKLKYSLLGYLDYCTLHGKKIDDIEKTCKHYTGIYVAGR